MQRKLGSDQGICITKIKTGFGTGGWQLAALRWCAKAARKPIIADGESAPMEISQNICSFWGNDGHDWFIVCWT